MVDGELKSPGELLQHGSADAPAALLPGLVCLRFLLSQVQVQVVVLFLAIVVQSATQSLSQLWHGAANEGVKMVCAWGWADRLAKRHDFLNDRLGRWRRWLWVRRRWWRDTRVRRECRGLRWHSW